MSTLSVDEVIEGLTDWLGDEVNSIYEEAMVGDEPAMLGSYDTSDDDDEDTITGYRIVIETTNGLKPNWMPTEIGCYQIVVRQGNMAEAQNGR